MSRFPITPEPELSVSDKLRITLDLAEAGTDVMRENLRRSHPGADDAEVERLLVEWLHERPGAELGDADGRPCQRFRTA